MHVDCINDEGAAAKSLAEKALGRVRRQSQCLGNAAARMHPGGFLGHHEREDTRARADVQDMAAAAAVQDGSRW